MCYFKARVSEANVRAWTYFIVATLAMLGLGTAIGPARGQVSDQPLILWQIGVPDRQNGEFALAPNRYAEFKQDGLFVVGQSTAAVDWPYVHPGPADAWAGGRDHTFTIAFGLKSLPGPGTCTLRIGLIDTQKASPPRLRIRIGSASFNRSLPAGAGDASVFGEPAKGKPQQLEITFPCDLLRVGNNEIEITTRTGSWMLYDAVALETPPGAHISDVSGAVLSGVHSPPVLVERDGQMRQPVRLSIRNFGAASQAQIRMERAGADSSPGAPVIEHVCSLKPGVNAIELGVAAVQRQTELKVIADVAGQTIGTDSITLKPVRKWVVYLLPHSHVDIGYTHVQTEVEQAQWSYLETAMETARKTADYPAGSRFKWNVEVLWAVDSYLQRATPEKRQAFFEAVKNGQIGLDALYGNMLTGLCRPEELLRLLRLATELTKKTGIAVESAMITDVPGYTWGVVPAFVHSGVRYFSIGPNGGDRIGHTTAAWGDKPFWWVGPNGKDKLLVWMTGTGYYRVFSSGENLLRYLDQLDAKGYPYDFVQVRHCLGDNGAPDVTFAETVKQWNEAHAYPKLVIATTAEMFHDFERRYGEQIPTAQGDFTPYWEDGAASSARETALVRAAADRLVQAETLFALFNPRAYPIGDFYRAWRNVVLYNEHTWGAHNSISQPDDPFVKSQWAIKQAFALDAHDLSRKLIDKAVAARGARPPESLPAGVAAVDVVNTLSATVSDALITVAPGLVPVGETVKTSPAAATSLPSQRLTSGELVFRCSLKGYESRRFYITSGSGGMPAFEGAKAEGLILMSGNASSQTEAGPGLVVRLDEKTGSIASLRYRDQELVDPKASVGLNEYVYLPGTDPKDQQRNGQPTITVKERGPLMASLLVESDAPGARRLTREVRVHALRHYVEIIDTIDKLPVRAKEGVHFGFGFNVPGGRVRFDVPWGVVRPEEDQLPGACKNWLTVQRWVDISNSSYGVTWLTPDAPLIELGGLTANLVGSLNNPKLWLNKLEPAQTIYSWAMNNHWHTNYRADQEGPTTFRYYLWPHGPVDGDDAARFALEISQGPISVPAAGPERSAPFQIEPADRVQVTAFKPSDDGRGYIIRLFNATGDTEKVTLNWRPPAPAKIWYSGNNEVPLEQVDGPVAVPPATIVTVRADFGF